MITKHNLIYFEKYKYFKGGDTLVFLFNVDYSLKDDDLLLSVGGTMSVLEFPNKDLRRLFLKAEDRWKSFIEVYRKNNPVQRLIDYAL